MSEDTPAITRAESHRRRRPMKPTVAVSYRFSEETVHLIDDAVEQAARAGRKLTRNEAVQIAVQETYGHLRRRAS